MLILGCKIAILIVLLRTKNLLTGGFGFLTKGITYAIACILSGLIFTLTAFSSDGSSLMHGIFIYTAYVSALSIGFFYAEDRLGSTVFNVPLLIIGGIILVFFT